MSVRDATSEENRASPAASANPTGDDDDNVSENSLLQYLRRSQVSY